MHVDAKVIDRWHRQKGWMMIGYHFVILRDGTVEKGREINAIGAHVEGHNYDSVGLCLAGGLNEDTGKPESNYTPAQWETLKKLVKNLQVLFPAAVVQGHRDFPAVAKACPCFDVKSWVLKELAH
jgi:N-acetylmuramoyl-L-alanine amidase